MLVYKYNNRTVKAISKTIGDITVDSKVLKYSVEEDEEILVLISDLQYVMIDGYKVYECYKNIN